MSIQSPLLPIGWPEQSDWTEPLADVMRSTWWRDLDRFVRLQRKQSEIYPATQDTFRAFSLTPLSKVKFVILGQDPYHGPNQAHGLCFSVPASNKGNKIPPSLGNIFKELKSDLQIDDRSDPVSGDLTGWALQGGLLLNSVLTVQAGLANSHSKQGWEKFTNAVIQIVDRHQNHVAFIFWGAVARKKASMIDSSKHLIIESAHPSPLSAYRGFFGSRPFSKVNQYRLANGLPAIDWSLGE